MVFSCQVHRKGTGTSGGGGRATIALAGRAQKFFIRPDIYEGPIQAFWVVPEQKIYGGHFAPDNEDFVTVWTRASFDFGKIIDRGFKL